MNELWVGGVKDQCLMPGSALDSAMSPPSPSPLLSLAWAYPCKQPVKMLKINSRMLWWDRHPTTKCTRYDL